jgi:hypothetical protein
MAATVSWTKPSDSMRERLCLGIECGGSCGDGRVVLCIVGAACVPKRGLVMRALWQRGQQGSTRARQASKGAELLTRLSGHRMNGVAAQRRSRRWMGVRGEHGDEAKGAASATRTALDVEACDALPECTCGFGGGRFVHRDRHMECSARARGAFACCGWRAGHSAGCG